MLAKDRARVVEWAKALTLEQAIPLLIELVEFANKAEYVSVHGLVPSWDGTGEPLIDGQKVYED